jgi:hypothetical protein
MTEEQRRKIEKRITILSLAIIGILIVIMILLGVAHLADTIWFPVLTAVFLLLYWLVSDVASVRWLPLFEGKTEEQKRAYCLYAVTDLISLGGLVYFIIDTQSSTGVIIYVVCTFLKRKFRTDFSGEEETEDAKTDEATVEETVETGEAIAETVEETAEMSKEDAVGTGKEASEIAEETAETTEEENEDSEKK